MNFNHDDIGEIEILGYTRQEARFLYLVAMHSGYFVTRHFLQFMGNHWTMQACRFLTKLKSRGHATWRKYQGVGGVYHLVSRTVYRRIGQENLRNQFSHSTDFIRTRLVLLDFVLANLSYQYFETGPAKVALFCDTLGLPTADLPAKSRTYRSGRKLTVHFVDRFPLFVDPTDPAAPAIITFTYIDPGESTLAAFKNHLRKYLPLFRSLENLAFLYISPSPTHFAAAERWFSSLVSVALNRDTSAKVLRYFRLRHAWELKQFGSLSAVDVEWLKNATSRFGDEAFEKSYRQWTSGSLSDQDLITACEAQAPRKISFRTYLTVPYKYARSQSGSGERTPQDDLLDNTIASSFNEYCHFIECNPNYVIHFALQRLLSRDLQYRQWKAMKKTPAAGLPAPASRNDL